MTPPHGKQILIVDSDQDGHESLAAALDKAGHQTKATWSGVEALQELKRHDFDVLLVGGHVGDMYVGDFLDRACRLKSCPEAWIMCESPPRNALCQYGSRQFPVISREALLKLFVANAPEEGGSASGPKAN